jgi:hypothetical protein
MDIHAVIQSQYHASLQMLGQVIEKCPPDLWDREEDKNKFWLLAYHALFYTHLYLSPSDDRFIPWEKHRDKIQFMGAGSSGQEPVKSDMPYSKAEILAYHKFLLGKLNEMVKAVDLHAESGFHWLPFSKLELQFYNLRHLMQHTGELGERLGNAAQLDVDWIGMGPESR